MSKDLAISDDYEPDPVFVNSWRETVVIISLFLFFMFWTVCVSFFLGLEKNYLPEDGSPIQLILGMPNWVFWGVFIPWMVVNLIGVWFCFGFMKDDDLGEEQPNEIETGMTGGDR